MKQRPRKIDKGRGRRARSYGVEVISMLNKIAEKMNKSTSLVLFEFMKDTHPITFKRMLKNEEKIRDGTAYPHNRPTHYVTLKEGTLVEEPIPEATRIKFDKYYSRRLHANT